MVIRFLMNVILATSFSDTKAETTGSPTTFIPACLSLATNGPSSYPQSSSGRSVISSMLPSSSPSSELSFSTISDAPSTLKVNTGSQGGSAGHYSLATSLPMYPACLAALTTSGSRVMSTSYSVSQNQTSTAFSMATASYMTNVSVMQSNQSKSSDDDKGINVTSVVSTNTNNASPTPAANLSSLPIPATKGDESSTVTGWNPNPTTNRRLPGSTFSNDSITLMTPLSRTSNYPNTVSKIDDNASTLISRSRAANSNDGTTIKHNAENVSADVTNTTISFGDMNGTSSVELTDNGVSSSEAPDTSVAIDSNRLDVDEGTSTSKIDLDEMNNTFSVEKTDSYTSSEVSDTSIATDSRRSNVDEVTSNINSNTSFQSTPTSNVGQKMDTSTAEQLSNNSSSDLLTTSIEEGFDGSYDAASAIISSTVDSDSTSLAIKTTSQQTSVVFSDVSSSSGLLTTTVGEHSTSTESVKGRAMEPTDSSSFTLSATSERGQNAALTNPYTGSKAFQTTSGAGTNIDVERATENSDHRSSTAATPWPSNSEDIIPLPDNKNRSSSFSKTRVNNRFIIFELFDTCRALSKEDVIDLFKNNTMPNQNSILFSLEYYVRLNCTKLSLEQQMATISAQTLGNLWVISCCSIAFFISIISGNYRFYEHKLNRVEEIVLIICHSIIIFSATKLPDNVTSCRLIWFFLHFLYAVLFVLLLLETMHNYSMVTNSIRSSPFLGTALTFLMVLVIPAFICGWLALFKWPDLLSPRSCWVQYDRRCGYVSLAPVLTIVVITSIPLEASFFTSYRPLPLSSKVKMTLCSINQLGLIILFPLNVASWLIMPFAIYTHNIPSYPIGCAVNIALGFAILTWHLASNGKFDIFLVPRVFWSISAKILLQWWKLISNIATYGTMELIAERFLSHMIITECRSSHFHTRSDFYSRMILLKLCTHSHYSKAL